MLEHFQMILPGSDNCYSFNEGNYPKNSLQLTCRRRRFLTFPFACKRRSWAEIRLHHSNEKNWHRWILSTFREMNENTSDMRFSDFCDDNSNNTCPEDSFDGSKKSNWNFLTFGINSVPSNLKENRMQRKTIDNVNWMLLTEFWSNRFTFIILRPLEIDGFHLKDADFVMLIVTRLFVRFSSAQISELLA